MKNRRAHKFISMVLTATLLCTLFAPYASAASWTKYSGNFAVVNTNLSTSSRSDTTFGSEETEESSAAMRMLLSGDGEMKGITGIRIDPETGETLYIKDKDLPKAEEYPITTPTARKNNNQKSVEYSKGDQKSFYEDNGELHDMVCCYVGQYCTVWGCESDKEYDSRLMLTEEQAKAISEKYDGYYQAIVTAYGDWYDADGDDKLAIFCFDIEQDYEATSGTSFSGGYVAGYFWDWMLADKSGNVNGKVNVGSSIYSRYFINTDCICIDTFPAMGSSKNNPLSNVTGDLSTLVHENQHLINFSYKVLGSEGIADEMELFMNEAFSMGAEHMICGPEVTYYDRVRYFNNSSDYVKGYPLTYWDYDTDVLSNYANSYLFGQYLRTRYAALKNDPTDPDGNTFYKKMLQDWQSKGGTTSAMNLAADIFGTTPKQLVMDFWAAVYLKNDTGWYGFQGEDWADKIKPLVTTSNRTKAKNIGSGGVWYYSLGTTSIITKPADNIKVIRFNSDKTVTMDGVPVLSNVSVQRTAADKVKLSFTASLAGTLAYTLSESTVVDPHDLKQNKSFVKGSNTLTLDISSGTSDTPMLNYIVKGSNVMSEIQSKKVPGFYDNELNYGGFFCGCKGDQFTVSGTFSSGEKLCVVSYDANGRMLGCRMMTAAGTVSLPKDTDYIGLMSLDRTYLPKIARGEMDLSD